MAKTKTKIRLATEDEKNEQAEADKRQALKKLGLELVSLETEFANRVSGLRERADSYPENKENEELVAEMRRKIDEIEERWKTITEGSFEKLKVGTMSLSKIDPEEFFHFRSALAETLSKNKNPDRKDIHDAVKKDSEKLDSLLRKGTALGDEYISDQGKLIASSYVHPQPYAADFYSSAHKKSELDKAKKELVKANSDAIRLLLDKDWENLEGGFQNIEKIENAKFSFRYMAREYLAARKDIGSKITDLIEKMDKMVEESDIDLDISNLINKVARLAATMAQMDTKVGSIIAKNTSLKRFDTDEMEKLIDSFRNCNITNNNWDNLIWGRSGVKTMLDSLHEVAGQFKELNKFFESFSDLVKNPPRKVEKASDKEISAQSFYSVFSGKPQGEDNIKARKTMFLFNGDHLEYLHTTKASAPLRFVEVKPSKGFNTKFFDLKKGDFCNGLGCKLPAELSKFISDAYHQSATGVEMLPDPKNKEGYRAKIPRSLTGESEPIKPRTWGQLFLAQLKPDYEKTGELLGSGGSYKAYTFGNKTIVEFDHEQHGTYFFDTKFFDSLRQWSRSEIISKKPQGFYYKINHKDDKRDVWENKVSDFLGIDSALAA